MLILLVNMFARCELVGMYWPHLKPLSHFSLMKCLSSSICLLLSYCTKLQAMLIVNFFCYSTSTMSHLWSHLTEFFDPPEFSLIIITHIPLKLLLEILTLTRPCNYILVLTPPSNEATSKKSAVTCGRTYIIYINIDF